MPHTLGQWNVEFNPRTTHPSRFFPGHHDPWIVKNRWTPYCQRHEPAEEDLQHWACSGSSKGSADCRTKTESLLSRTVLSRESGWDHLFVNFWTKLNFDIKTLEAQLGLASAGSIRICNVSHETSPGLLCCGTAVSTSHLFWKVFLNGLHVLGSDMRSLDTVTQEKPSYAQTSEFSKTVRIKIF